MSGIQDIMEQQLAPERIAMLSRSIGADPAATSQAVEAAIPTMMSAMKAHAASQQGSEAIETAAAEHSGIGTVSGGAMAGGLGTILGDVDGMFGGGTGGILGSILGPSHASVRDGVIKASGLDRQKAGQLMMILAPIVLSVIARDRDQG